LPRNWWNRSGAGVKTLTFGISIMTQANRDRTRLSQSFYKIKNKIGGMAEVVTPSGKIDLLTDTEVIEVKKFDEWKSALGQVLAYSAFFPSHTKHIHLFGTAQQLKKLSDIQSACLTFDVLVTGEEV
jgi:hypothetical protein